MSLIRSFLCATALTLVGAEALANPYSNQVLRTRAVPGPHVQITYAKVGGGFERMLSDIVEMGSTYGAQQTSWKYGGSFRANTGSGVVGLYSIQRCDCFVPKGPLTYRLTVHDSMVLPEPRDMTLTSTVTVSDSFDAAVHPDGWGMDGGRWNEPEPSEIQGLDCTVACVTGDPDASTDAPMSTIPDASADSDNKTDALMSNAPEVALDLRTASPDLIAASPDVLTSSPDVLTSSPDVPTAAPDVAVPDAPAVSIDVASPVATPDARSSAPQPSNSKAQGSKGCSISPQTPTSGLPFVALLALLALRRRRG